VIRDVDRGGRNVEEFFKNLADHPRHFFVIGRGRVSEKADGNVGSFFQLFARHIELVPLCETDHQISFALTEKGNGAPELGFYGFSFLFGKFEREFTIDKRHSLTPCIIDSL